MDWAVICRPLRSVHKIRNQNIVHVIHRLLTSMSAMASKLERVALQPSTSQCESVKNSTCSTEPIANIYNREHLIPFLALSTKFSFEQLNRTKKLVQFVQFRGIIFQLVSDYRKYLFCIFYVLENTFLSAKLCKNDRIQLTRSHFCSTVYTPYRRNPYPGVEVRTLFRTGVCGCQLFIVIT